MFNFLGLKTSLPPSQLYIIDQTNCLKETYTKSNKGLDITQRFTWLTRWWLMSMVVVEYGAEEEFWLCPHFQRMNKELWYVQPWSGVEQTGHMLTYGTSKLGSLVDQNSWIEFTPLGVGSWRGHSLKPVSRSGPTGGPSRGANPGLGKLGSRFSIFLVKGCHVQFTGSCMWCVPSYLLEDVNRFKSPQF
jgi:hypothetical protein